jgi:hypothetical protein
VEGLVSREDKFRALHSQFDNPKPYAVYTIIGLLAAVASVPLVLKLAQRILQRMQNEPRNRPRRLLWDLSARVSLGWFDRMVLLRMTRRTRYPHPAAVLLSADLFDRLAKQWVDERGGSGANRLREIRRRLFPD